MKPVALTVVLIWILTACSSGPGPSSTNEKLAGKSSAPQPQPTQTLLGRAALQKCYVTARGWSADAQPFSLESTPTKEVSGAEGKSAVWTARFGSQIRATAKAFAWSGTDAEDAPPRGMNPGAEDTFNPSNSSTRTFDLAFLKSDSDTAFEAAQAHGGKKILAKNAALPIVYRLGWDPRSNTLEWHVLYGGTGTDQKLVVAVNASTGQFIRVEK